jgi:hypothetical protein
MRRLILSPNRHCLVEPTTLSVCGPRPLSNRSFSPNRAWQRLSPARAQARQPPVPWQAGSSSVTLPARVTRSLYFKNERVTTLNGRRKPLGLLHPAIPSRAHWNPAQLPSNQQNGAAARLAQLWARSQNGGALRPGEHWQRGFRRGNAATSIFIQLEFKLSSPFVPESTSPFS